MNIRAILFSLVSACLIVEPAIAGSQTYGYRQQVHNVVNETLILGVPYVPDYFYSVGRDRDEDAKRIADAVMLQFEKKFLVNQPAPAESRPAEQRKLSREDFSIVGGRSSASIDQKVLAIFDNNCIKCHKPGANKPGVQLQTSDRKLFVESDPRKELRRRERIYDSCDHTSGGTMPKNSPSLVKSEMELLKEWIDDAAAKIK